MSRQEQDEYFSGNPTSQDWEYLRQFAAAVYEPAEGDGLHGLMRQSVGSKIHPSEDMGTAYLYSNIPGGKTDEYSSKSVPYKVFQVHPETFSFNSEVTCVVAFRGTNPKEGVGRGSDLHTDYNEIVKGSKSRSGPSKPERIKLSIQHLFSFPKNECDGGIIATGHSLGGCTALNAAVYGGVRAFTFAGPGPTTGGANKLHPLAQMATTTSATLYAGGDVIPFAAQHIGDRMCRLEWNGEPKMIEAEEYNEMEYGSEEFSDNINIITAGEGLAGHKSVLAEPLFSNGHAQDNSCFSNGRMSGFKPVPNMAPDLREWAQHHFGHNGEVVFEELLSI